MSMPRQIYCLEITIDRKYYHETNYTLKSNVIYMQVLCISFHELYSVLFIVLHFFHGSTNILQPFLCDEFLEEKGWTKRTYAVRGSLSITY